MGGINHRSGAGWKTITPHLVQVALMMRAHLQSSTVASELGCTREAVVSAIRSLERVVGACLFDRHKNGPSWAPINSMRARAAWKKILAMGKNEVKP